MCIFRSVFNITLLPHTLQVPCSSMLCYFFMCIFRSVFNITFTTHCASPMFFHLMLLLHEHLQICFYHHFVIAHFASPVFFNSVTRECDNVFDVSLVFHMFCTYCIAVSQFYSPLLYYHVQL